MRAVNSMSWPRRMQAQWPHMPSSAWPRIGRQHLDICVQRIPDVAHSPKKLAIAGVAQSLPQAVDLDVDRAVGRLQLALVRQFDQQPARQHSSRVHRKCAQQAIFGCGQRDQHTVRKPQLELPCVQTLFAKPEHI